MDYDNYPFSFTVVFLDPINEGNTYATETGMGFASSFANATAILEKTYGTCLVAIKHLELYEPTDVIVLNKDIVNQYSKDNFSFFPCDHEGNIINQEDITNEC
jgi:hypothetical protein